jgi:hypothetical protein
MELKEGAPTDVPVKAAHVHVKNLEIAEQIIQAFDQLLRMLGVQPDGHL